MPALLAPALLQVALGAGLILSQDLGLQTEVRTERLEPATGERRAFTALEVRPEGTLRGRARTLEVDLAYAPVYTHRWEEGGDRDTWLHLASAAARWRASPGWLVRGDGRLTLGVVDLFRQPPSTGGPGTPPPAGGQAPIASTIDYLRSELSLGVEGALAPRLRLDAGLAASREGGLGEAARAVVPLQQAGRATVDLGWQATRATTFSAWLAGEVTHFFDVQVADAAAPGGIDRRSWSAWSGRVGGSWRQALGREGRTWLAAGAALAGGDGPGQPDLRPTPTGEAGIGLSPEAGTRRPRLELVVAAAPVEDRTTGLVSTRADARAWLAWDPVERWTVEASVTAGRTLDGPTERDAFVLGEARLGWAVFDWLRLAVGGRRTSQWTPRLSPDPTVAWAVLGSLEAVHRGRP